MRPGQADVARATQPGPTHGLRERAFDAGASGVLGGIRVARSASYCSWGRTVMVRRGDALRDRMQSARWGQGPQSFVENLILMTWLRRLSMAGVQLMLVRPAGQVACSRSQSIANRCASKPCPARACQW